MSLKRSIRRATKVAFKKTKTTQTEVTYLELGEEQYDTETKEASRPITAQHTLKGILSSYTTEEVLSGMVSPEDQRLTLERAKVTWEVDAHDEVRINGEDWKIKKFKAEPSESVVILHLTKE